jgi:hypothetical protein
MLACFFHVPRLAEIGSLKTIVPVGLGSFQVDRYAADWRDARPNLPHASDKASLRPATAAKMP